MRVKRALHASLLAATLAGSPLAALAQDPPPREYAPPPPPPPRPPPPQRAPGQKPYPVWENPSWYNHDGFLLRFGLGPAFLKPRASSAPSSQIGVGFFFTLGGELAPGLFLAGDLALTGAGSSRSSDSSGTSGSTGTSGATSTSGTSGTAKDNRINATTLAVALSYYPDPKGGLHFGGGVGGSWLELQPLGSSNGVGLHGAVGYEGWTSRSWSLGGALRLDVFTLSSSRSLIAPGLYFVGTFS